MQPSRIFSVIYGVRKTNGGNLEMKKEISVIMAMVMMASGIAGCSGEKRTDDKKDREKETEEVLEEETEETTETTEWILEEPQVQTATAPNTGAGLIGIPETPLELGTWKESMLQQLTLPGYWTVLQDTGIPDDIDTVFDEAGSDYTTVALVAEEKSMDDDSCNYCFLCKADQWFYLFVNKDAQGNCSFCNTFYFDLQQGFEADITETYLSDHPEYQGMWTLSEDGVITDELYEIYNSACDVNDMYKTPLAYLGEGSVEDMPVYCFLTTANLYCTSNDDLMLTYICEGTEGVYMELEKSCFTLNLMSQCPDISVSEPPTRSSIFYTYGTWAVPSSKDSDSVPSEIIDMVTDAGYTPVAYVIYKECLHPDHTALLRVLFCQDSDGNCAFVFTEEDEAGNISITNEVPFGIETVAENSIVRAEDVPNNGGWTVDITADIPDELMDAYYQLYNNPTRIMGYGEPEYLLATKIDDTGIKYLFLCEETITSYRSNGYIDLVIYSLDTYGSLYDEQTLEVNMGGLMDHDVNYGEGSTLDSTLNYVYGTVITVDTALATELVNEDNRDEYGITVNCNNIDLVILSYETREDAEACWQSMRTAFESDIVYEGNNYFYSDSMGNGNLFNYVFVTQNDVVFIQTADIYQVTTVANIGDNLVTALP